MAENITSQRRGLIALTDDSDLPDLVAKLSAIYKIPISLTRVKGKNRRNLMKKYNLMERINSLSPSKKAVMINFRKQNFLFEIQFNELY
jgi:hypothetical protein